MNKTITERSIPLDDIEFDEDLQIRCEINWETVDDYAELIKAGTELPKSKVFEDNDGKIWIADGWHRILSHKKLRRETVDCHVQAGSRQDALKYALGANASHGLRRTNKDKRRAVLIALEAFPKLSARGIAGLCKVHHQTVINVKNEVSNLDTCVGQDGKIYKTPEPKQLDFWEQLNVAYEPIKSAFKLTMHVPDWMNPDIPKEEKLEAVRALKAQVTEMKRELNERERQIIETIED